MNTFEFIKMNNDTGIVPVKYVIMDVTVGSTLANSYVWLKCATYGISTQANLDKYYEDPDSKFLAGALGSYSISNLSLISAYSKSINLKETRHNIG